jgi:hypothetical protein
MFDPIFFTWLNFVLVMLAIFYAHAVVRSFNSIYIGIPLIIWLFQALIFYFVYLGYYYNILLIEPSVASKLYTYWATFSRTLGLLTMFIYLYYIKNSCWRGDDNS